MPEERDYLAIANIGMGAGSYARGPNRETVISDLKRIIRSDWKTLFKPKKLPFEMEIVVWDVTESGDTLHWNDGGTVWAEESNGPNQPPKRIYVNADRAKIEKITYKRW